MRRKTIVVAEDDHFWMEFDVEMIEKRFPDYKVVQIRTEDEFRKAMPGFSKNPPAPVVLCMRMKWCFPEREMPEPPPDVLAEGCSLTGARCWRLLRKSENTANVPVIFHTVIDEKSNVSQEVLGDPRTVFVERSSRYDQVLKDIRRMLEFHF